MKLTKQNLTEKTQQIYDAIVIGGGVGGLSAGIYLQRYLLSSLIIDKGKARSFWMQDRILVLFYLEKMAVSVL